MSDLNGFTAHGFDKSGVEYASKFIYFENFAEFISHKNFHGIELCILDFDIDDTIIGLVAGMIGRHMGAEFWLVTEDLRREKVVEANNIGIKNLLARPFEFSYIENYFKEQNLAHLKSQSSAESSYDSLQGMNVMIVDDNQANIDLLVEILDGFDLSIFSFCKPEKVFETLQREKIDLFLLDVMMPEISGFDLAKTIKEMPKYASTPIVFISALSDSQNIITGYDLGSCAYIEKPFDVNIIKSQIYNLLKSQKIQEIVSSSKDLFWATAAHDLKTPISAEISVLKMLLNSQFGDLDEAQREIVQDILSSTKFMQNMVENLMMKNKIETGKVSLFRQIYSLKEVIEHSIDLTKYILIEKRQKISFVDNTKGTMLPYDFVEIKRALHNVIANASAHSPLESEIIVQSQKNGTEVEISVRDFGEGIAPESLQYIFEEYISVAKNKKTLGSGLGLYITKNIVEAHGGRVSAQSTVGEGTKISLFLPMYTKVRKIP